jgi:hypothetical protein
LAAVLILFAGGTIAMVLLYYAWHAAWPGTVFPLAALVLQAIQPAGLPYALAVVSAVGRRACALGGVGDSMSDKGKVEEIKAEVERLRAIVGQETFDRIRREVWAKFANQHPSVDETGWMVPGTMIGAWYALLKALRAEVKH